MKAIFKLLSKAICHFSIMFSAIILFFWSLMKESGYIDYEKIRIFFFFALVFGISSLFFSIPKVPRIVVQALHFIVNTIAFLSTFVTIDGMTPVRSFVVGTVFVILYLLISLLIFGAKKLVSKLSAKSEE